MKAHEQRLRAQRAAAVVGIDAGKVHHALVVRPRGEPDSRPLVFRTNLKGFERAVAFIDEATGGAPHKDVLVGIEFAGVYGFTLAHYLHQLGFGVVSVLAAHTKRWKEVIHRQPLKTDEKDAANITDLAAQGRFVTFPFLDPAYAELRYLVSGRERLITLRNAGIARLKSSLEVVWPEFEDVFSNFQKKTPLALLDAFPTPEALLSAPRRRVLTLLRKASRGQCGEETYERLREAARSTVALPGAQGVLCDEVRIIVERLRLFGRQITSIEESMATALLRTPEGPHLLTVPKCAPVTAAVFLGLIGDPQAYESSRQILTLSGLQLVTSDRSGLRQGTVRISKRGKPVLRRHAFMFAMRHVRKDGIYRAEFRRLVEEQRRPKKEAIVILERKALRLLYSIARERRDYTAERPAHKGGEEPVAV